MFCICERSFLLTFEIGSRSKSFRVCDVKNESWQVCNIDIALIRGPWNDVQKKIGVKVWTPLSHPHHVLRKRNRFSVGLALIFLPKRKFRLVYDIITNYPEHLDQ